MVSLLPRRYCSGKFACRLPTWGLPARGHLQGLIADFAGIGEVSRSDHVDRARLPGLVGGAGVFGGRKILGASKEFGYTGKPQHTLQDVAGRGILSLDQGSGRD